MSIKHILITMLVLFAFCGDQQAQNNKSSFDDQVASYIQKFPYQDTYNYMNRYTAGKASNLNVWILGKEPVLVKAGEDKVVRMNNDTYYKMAFMDFSKGPVTLSSTNGSKSRFSSFQLMDDRNANFENVIHPNGDYYLYYGEKPKGLDGQLIESPSEIAVVIVRVEVRDKDNAEDVMSAKKIFGGITIEGPEVDEFPSLDLLGAYDEKVTAEANRLMDATFKMVPFSSTVASPDQVPGKVSYLNFAAGTKGGWGGPVTKHSAYETLFFDEHGDILDANKGSYSVTTTEPPVDAFWSITVYDTERGGYLHPNADDRYHINNTTAVKNDNGTLTFLFKTKCDDGDMNCLEVPTGPFDLVARYYLPKKKIRSGNWTLPGIQLMK